MVNQLGTVSFSQLREIFPNVSEVTLRKDLKQLDDEGQLIRTHGGAKSIPSLLNITYRSGINIAEKQIIAEKAAQLIKPSDTIYITAGTTCAELAKKLPNFPIYIFTDGIYTTMNIPKSVQATVQILGGEVKLNTMRVEDWLLPAKLDQLSFSTAFIGTTGLHPDRGFSFLSSMTVAILEKALSRAQKAVVLMDSSKLNYTITPCCIPLEAVDVVVTDGKLPKDAIEKLESKGIEVI